MSVDEAVWLLSELRRLLREISPYPEPGNGSRKELKERFAHPHDWAFALAERTAYGTNATGAFNYHLAAFLRSVVDSELSKGAKLLVMEHVRCRMNKATPDSVASIVTSAQNPYLTEQRYLWRLAARAGFYEGQNAATEGNYDAERDMNDARKKLEEFFSKQKSKATAKSLHTVELNRLTQLLSTLQTIAPGLRECIRTSGRVCKIEGALERIRTASEGEDYWAFFLAERFVYRNNMNYEFVYSFPEFLRQLSTVLEELRDASRKKVLKALRGFSSDEMIDSVYYLLLASQHAFERADWDKWRLAARSGYKTGKEENAPCVNITVARRLLVEVISRHESNGANEASPSSAEESRHQALVMKWQNEQKTIDVTHRAELATIRQKRKELDAEERSAVVQRDSSHHELGKKYSPLAEYVKGRDEGIVDFDVGHEIKLQWLIGGSTDRRDVRRAMILMTHPAKRGPGSSDPRHFSEVRKWWDETQSQKDP